MPLLKVVLGVSDFYIEPHEISLSFPVKNRNSLAWVLSTLSPCPTYRDCRARDGGSLTVHSETTMGVWSLSAPALHSSSPPKHSALTAKSTVRGGQQMCNQASRPCRGGGVTATSTGDFCAKSQFCAKKEREGRRDQKKELIPFYVSKWICCITIDLNAHFHGCAVHP